MENFCGDDPRKLWILRLQNYACRNVIELAQGNA